MAARFASLISSGLSIFMEFIADFHIHSKYSRATSPQMDLENLDCFAQKKGITVMGTGDFTHPAWFKELKEKLVPAEPGLYKLKVQSSKFKVGVIETRFILTSEISCIYSKNGRVRKVHMLIFCPDFLTVEKINAQLSWIGNLKADGRPILGLDVKELAKIALNSSSDCLVVPAHCLLPDTYIHVSQGLKTIKEISKGDLVFTHKGRLKKVEKVYKRPYRGEVFSIQPFYFRLGIKTTPEHPFFAIKSKKYCPTFGCKMVCKKNCNSQKKRNCSYKYFQDYQPQWVQAQNIEQGDILIFPRFNKVTRDIKTVQLNKYLEQKEYQIQGNFIRPLNGIRANLIPKTIKIDKDFCRLVGYYLSEGYTDNRDSVSFCFNEREVDYIEDVKNLMLSVFNLSYCREYKRKDCASIELIFFSKPLAKIFSRVFYVNNIIRRAHTKCLPDWILNLPLEKQAEILRGWWRGDAGYTNSRILMNQMKIICLRLGIIPSIGVLEDIEKFNQRKHKIGNRYIIAKYATFCFSNLSFFEDCFGLLNDPCFKKFNTKLKRRHGWIDKDYIYIPVREIAKTSYEGEVYNLEVEDDNSYVGEFVAIHNCWTPWFSVFGSKSGFDSLQECFDEYTPHIYACETGLSSDPAMNWRLSGLDKVALISNSDAHSPQKIGREANVYNTELSYPGIAQAIKTKDLKKFLSTIEFFPEEGRYHYDGHRLCNVCLAPVESKKLQGICPKCKRPLTIGVLSRVEDLADRPEGFVLPNAIPFKSLIPLDEVIAEARGVGVGTKDVMREYQCLLDKFGTEFNVLLKADINDIKAATLPEIALAIESMRNGNIKIDPGYDGEYGKIHIFGALPKPDIGQKALF